MKINYIYNTELTSKLPVLTCAELRNMLPAVNETALHALGLCKKTILFAENFQKSIAFPRSP